VREYVPVSSAATSLLQKPDKSITCILFEKGAEEILKIKVNGLSLVVFCLFFWKNDI